MLQGDVLQTKLANTNRIHYTSHYLGGKYESLMVTSPGALAGDVFDYVQWVCPEGYRIHVEKGAELGRSPRTTSEFLATSDGPPTLEPLGVESERVRPLATSDDIAGDLTVVGPTDADVLAFCNRFGLLYPWGSSGNTVARFRDAQQWVAGLRNELVRLRGKWDGKADSLKFRQERRKLGQRFNAEASQRFTFRLRLPATDKDTGGVRLAPGSLMDAIALRLAYEIAGEVEWSRCAYCDKWFLKGAPGERVRGRNAITCSDTCTRSLMDDRKAKRAAAAKLAKTPAKPRKCVICGDRFTPKRATTIHCGKGACKTAVSRMNAKGVQP